MNLLKVSKHARERLIERLGSSEIAPQLMDRLKQANDCGASGLYANGWFYVIRNNILVTVRPKPRGNRTSAATDKRNFAAVG